MLSLQDALNEYNIQWSENEQHPSWVDLSKSNLDQFYTIPDTARKCYSQLLIFLKSIKLSESDCLFIEPSAGAGAFSSLLPPDSIIMDLEPASENIVQQDYLTWDAAADERIILARESGKTIVVVGNPPFGTRGWLALSFMNKSAEYADYCAFLLPMSFASEGKGSPKYRVNGMRVISSEEKLNERFVLPNGKDRKFNVVWQIWKRGENTREDFSQVDAKFTMKFISDLDYRLCGQDFKHEADVFVSQAYFPDRGMKITQEWSDVLYASAYGVKANDPADADKMIDILKSADWSQYSTASTHGCRHVGMTEIKRVLATAF